MFHITVAILRAIFLLFTVSARDIIIENVILKKENKILKRKNKKRIKFGFFDRLFYTVLNQRFYVFFIIRHQTREIIQFRITMNPVKEFVRQQMIEFTNGLRSSFLSERTSFRSFDV